MLVLLIGVAFYFKSRLPSSPPPPSPVGYNDTLTQANSSTFQKYHSWDDSNLLQSGDTTLAEEAIARLGAHALGKTFGALMDSQKTYEQDRDTANGVATLKREEAAARKATPNHVAAATQPNDDTVTFIAEGQVGTIAASASGTACFATQDDLDAFRKASIDNDKYGEENAVGNAYSLAGGVHVRDIGNAGFVSQTAHLRIEDGPNTGDDCWLPADAKGLFSDAHFDNN
jgi:hypothetical protein